MPRLCKFIMLWMWFFLLRQQKTPLWPYLIKCYSCPDLVVYNKRGKVHYDLRQSHGKHHSITAFNLCFSLCHGNRSTQFYTNYEHTFANMLFMGTQKAFNLKFRNTVIRPLMVKVNWELVLMWTLVTLYNPSLLSSNTASSSRNCL